MISVSFDGDDNAYAALTALKELDSQQRVGVEAAAVAVRGDDGAVAVKDSVGAMDYAGAASGGLVGRPRSRPPRAPSAKRSARRPRNSFAAGGSTPRTKSRPRSGS